MLMQVRASTLAIAATLLTGCAPNSITSKSNEQDCRSYKMEDMLAALPMKFWESPPSRVRLKLVFPKGVPEDYAAISGGGAQNDLDVLRLDGCSIAIAVGEGENPDYGASINPIGRNLEVLRRSPDGWTDITGKVLPRKLGANEKVQLHREGRLVITDTMNVPVELLRYNGTAFIPSAEQIMDANRPIAIQSHNNASH